MATTIATTIVPSGTDLPSVVQALLPNDIEDLPWESVGDCFGVYEKELCRLEDTVVALISYAPDGRTPGRPHPGAQHHLWVLRGSARIAGQHVGPGTYLYVPPGAPHPVQVTSSEGCELLQVHRLLSTAGGLG